MTRRVGHVPTVAFKLASFLRESPAKAICNIGVQDNVLFVFLHDAKQVDAVPFEFDGLPVRVFDLADNELR